MSGFELTVVNLLWSAYEGVSVRIRTKGYHIISKINVTPKGVRLSEKLQHYVMKFDRSNIFDLCYYGQINSLRLKSSVHLYINIFILLAMARIS